MRSIFALIVTLGLFAIGCGGSGTQVSGKVRYNGKPVVFGTVVMIGQDGVPKSGPIQPDGSYVIKNVKEGSAKVAVTSPTPPGMAKKGGGGRGGRDDGNEGRGDDADTPVSPEVAKGWFPLPEKFGDAEKSGVVVQVKAGAPVDVELK